VEALYLLIPISLVIVAIAVWIFFRMSDSGQFDDMEGPAHSILMDDDRPDPKRGSGEGSDARGADPSSRDR
jgi:cbb3-type cytochrome oxidase maturation protein